MKKKISIIVPFYNGNIYMNQLFASIENLVKDTKDIADYEVIIVNDSPYLCVELPLPKDINVKFDVKIIQNPTNQGIQKTRINGLEESTGEWILFLDQDDEIVSDGFKNQIKLTSSSDIVIGNGVYRLGDVNKVVYANKKCMDYLIKQEMFIKIRNLIPSPGECLIKKQAIPQVWKENILKQNGADDWLLWILLFHTNARFVCNPEIVYIHNDTNGQNLSSDLNKMRKSSIEMIEVLKRNKIINDKKQRILIKSINFKYYQDTKQLSIRRIISYFDILIANINYRLTLNYLAKG